MLDWARAKVSSTILNKGGNLNAAKSISFSKKYMKMLQERGQSSF